MNLTVNQIKQKQVELKKELVEKLNKFESETGIQVTGEIFWGYTNDKKQHYLTLQYSNPFS